MKLVDNRTYDALEEDSASRDYCTASLCCSRQKLKDTNNALKVGWQICALLMVSFIVDFKQRTLSCNYSFYFMRDQFNCH